MQERYLTSIAEEATQLCSLEIYEGTKGKKNHNKRGQASVTKKHIYHVRKREDLLQEGLIMKLEGLTSKEAHVGLNGRYYLYINL